ncbi:MAG: hypothetical protein WDN75_05205 [Bacteroidota bacterium]
MKSFLTIIFCLIGATLFSKDKGIGILSLSSDATGKVEVNIYEKEDVKSKILGSFFCQNTKEGQLGYKVQGKDVQE